MVATGKSIHNIYWAHSSTVIIIIEFLLEILFGFWNGFPISKVNIIIGLTGRANNSVCDHTYYDIFVHGLWFSQMFFPEVKQLWVEAIGGQNNTDNSNDCLFVLNAQNKHERYTHAQVRSHNYMIHDNKTSCRQLSVPCWKSLALTKLSPYSYIFL